MTLLSGAALESYRFFSRGNPKARGSSFDLTIGEIYDADGRFCAGPFALKPGHLVQVISREVFNLPLTITGHVTYKTALTRHGIWALTVGIVDPGWKGPVTTTLLNFSKVEYPISPGDVFLRVSFFEHSPVEATHTPAVSPIDEYTRNVQKAAMALFPPTFLNQQKIADDAGKNVLKRIRTESLAWIAAIAVIFTVVQVVLQFAPRFLGEDTSQLRARIDNLESRMIGAKDLSRKGISASSFGSDTPSPLK